MTGKMHKNSHTGLWCYYSEHIFAKRIGSVTRVSINKQLISIHNCFGVLSQLCQGRFKRRFVISSVSVGNILSPSPASPEGIITGHNKT